MLSALEATSHGKSAFGNMTESVGYNKRTKYHARNINQH